MSRFDPTALSLWGIKDQGWKPLTPVEWPNSVFLFRVWYEGPSTVKLNKNGSFVAHQRGKSMPIPRSEELRSKVYDHLGLKTQSSPFISTSLSFPWALVQAKKIAGSASTQEKVIKISIIQASALDPKTMLVALDGLFFPLRISEQYPLKEYNERRDWASHSQEVLVLNKIPASAVLGTVEFRADLQNAPELPWVTYKTTLIPRKYKKYEKYSAWEYTEHWARTFRQDLLSGDLSLDEHASNSLDLALRLLNASVNTADPTSQTPGLTELEDPVLKFATYLFLWPFRELPARRSNGPPLPEVQAPSYKEVVQRLQERWGILNEGDTDLHGFQSESGNSHDDSDELTSAMANVSIYQ